MKRCTKAQNGARLPGFAIRISVLRVCFGFRVSDFGFWARSRSLCGTILKTRKLFLHERLASKNAENTKRNRPFRERVCSPDRWKRLQVTFFAILAFLAV